jgi:two-component system CheB/CheR fusion protein
MARTKFTAKSPTQLVVVGSSAGGIEALSRVAASLPTPFPASIVIAQHLDPNRPSHLANILRRYSSLPVVSVTSPEALRAGTIYVVPANRHVEISDHTITLLEDGTNRPTPSVDLLLSTAAQVFGENLYAVILSGTGSDGTAGAREVSAAGGTVIIQDPATAAFPGMPRSLAPYTVDVVANVDEIGPLLHNLITGVGLPPSPNADFQLQAFLEQLRERSGFDFSAYKLATIRRRLQSRIVTTKTGDLAGYMRYLDSHPEEYQRLVSSFLIKVTEFMRDPDLFEALRTQVMPDLIRYARNHDRVLRIWSAGCATGEEAYSVAILIRELLGDELPDFNVKIFATDLDVDAVSFARRGIYSVDGLKSLSPDVVERYFNSTTHGYEVTKELRSMIVFGEHDLVQRAPFPHVDMVICRNVLIYFTKELQQHALSLFAFALRHDGYLVLGKTETVGPRPEYFKAQHGLPRIYRRHGGRPPLVSFQPSVAFRPHDLRTPLQRTHSPNMVEEFPSTQRILQRSQALQVRLLQQLPVGVLVVDERYDIHEINNAARRLLGVRSPGVGEDLVHLARSVPSRTLRAALDTSLKQNLVARLSAIEIPNAVTGETSLVDIVVHPFSQDESHVLAMVIVTDHSDDTGRVDAVLADQLVERGTAASAHAAITAENLQLRREIDELTSGGRSVEGTIASYTSRLDNLSEANRELLAANEELMRVSNDLRLLHEESSFATEEAQSAMEEAETLNEELQSTNEELETLNEELQATIEELDTSNADLAARTEELQMMTITLEEQREHTERDRAWLEKIFDGMSDATVVVTSDGTPVLTNPSYRRLFGLADPAGEGSGEGHHPPILRDVGLRPLPADSTPAARAASGEAFNMNFVIASGGDGNVRTFEAIGQPVTDPSDQRWGVVVIREVTDRTLRILQERFASLAGHELRTPLTAVSGYLQLIEMWLKNRPDTERPRHFTEIAIAEARRLKRLVDDLVDVSRLQSGKFNIRYFQPVDLGGLVARAVEIAQTIAAAQPIEVEIPGESLTVSGDPDRLQQVVLNLLVNAVTHAPDSPRIDVRLFRSQDGKSANIQVQDYGPGIPEESLPNLFSRFYQISRNTPPTGQGMGLGLYISRQIIAAHTGTISIDSTPGEGSTFTITLPLIEK